MSLCYDFQKWTMITLASIAISLTVGLVLMQYAHGQEDNNNQTSMKPTGKFEKIEGVYSEVIFFPNMTLNFPNMTSSR